MKTSRIFFDFDGTLIDSSIRLYQLFSELAPESSFSYKEYWDIKRNKINQENLLRNYFNYTDHQIIIFKEKWLKQIENPDRLILDVPFSGVSEFLKNLSKKTDLYIITARQNRDLVNKQVTSLEWKSFFQNIFVTEQKHKKSDILKSNFSSLVDDILIGDTGEDILAGKILGMQTFAVSSGVLNKKVLQTYKPDKLFTKVVDISF